MAKIKVSCELCNKKVDFTINCHCNKFLCPKCTLTRRDHEHWDILEKLHPIAEELEALIHEEFSKT